MGLDPFEPSDEPSVGIDEGDVAHRLGRAVGGDRGEGAERAGDGLLGEEAQRADGRGQAATAEALLGPANGELQPSIEQRGIGAEPSRPALVDDPDERAGLLPQARAALRH